MKITCVALLALAAFVFGQHEEAATTGVSSAAATAAHEGPVATVSVSVGGGGGVAEHSATNATASTASTGATAEHSTAAADEEEAPPTQKQLDKINFNGTNAIYVVVSLVGVMVATIAFSASSEEGNSEQVESLALIELDEGILKSHGGIPTYNDDGTLKSINESTWKPERQVLNPQRHVANLESLEQPEAERGFIGAMKHVADKRDFTKNQ
ncbi:UNVERIFIED_CONTAM: hypothetical protein HDU68_011161 [Siphonaria sp. JEL0065]|nr:hypothetical protein HDU68_011161 [Siphonaria sp. JEL0065]